MKRRFILHIGPTNSGKTHDALERLKQAEHGAISAPFAFWRWRFTTV